MVRRRLEPQLPDFEESGPSQPRSSAAPDAVHPRNTLNDLTGKEWLRFTRSWDIWDSKRYHRNRNTELHPARFPEEMVSEFVRFFTKRGEWVLDPFAGSGATLVACRETDRRAVGIELNAHYAALASRRWSPGQPSLCVLQGDARRVDEAAFWKSFLDRSPIAVSEGLPQFDFILTSPPYWRMLRTSRGGVQSAHKVRAAKGLDTVYSDDPADLGNIADYDSFVHTLGRVLGRMRPLLRHRRYLVVIVQNLRAPTGEVKPLAWDLARELSTTYLFQGEKIWCQNTKKLGIWGYPTTFVPNYHHHYCLIFRKV